MIHIEKSVLKSRMQDVEKILLEDGLNALVVFGYGSALGFGSRTHGYLRYLCNWDGHHTPSMLVLVPGKEPILLVSNIFLKFLAQNLLWFSDIRSMAPSRFAAEVAQIAKGSDKPINRLGYIGRDEMPVPVWEGLIELLQGTEWSEFADRIDKRRVVKDAVQLKFHRKAAQICDTIFETAQREVCSGKKAYQIQAEMERTARSQGCEFIQTWLTVAQVADYPRFYRDECLRVPEPGDQVLAGIFLIYDGHWGHAVRTGTYGPPADNHRRIFDIAYEIEEAGLEVLRPGGNLYDVSAAFENVLHRYYPDPDSQGVFRFRVAHGLGHSYEDPICSEPFSQPFDKHIDPQTDSHKKLLIQPGMLFEFHPNLFVRNVAGAAIGDMVLVTDTGYEILNQFPRELVEW